MKRFLLFLSALFCFAMTEAKESYTTKYIDLGRQSAVLYQPSSVSKKASVAFVVMHSHEDYLGFLGASELAKRGYTVLTTNPSSENTLESKLLHIKAAVEYMRKQKNIKKVILLGHSGGATVITAYEYLAEQGRDGLKGMLFTDYTHDIDNLPKADGMLLLDANPGLSTIMINSLDANVTDETNGWSTDSTYTYADERGYMHGQQARYARLVKKALERWKLIKAGKGLYADDEPFVIPGSESIRFFNKLYSSDTNLLAHTKGQWPLIHADGSITTEVVHSVRAPFQPIDKTENLSAAQQLTVKDFLGLYAVKTDTSYAVTPTGLQGIDFTSSLSSPIGNIRGVSIPSLFMGMTGSYEYLTAEAVYNNSPAKDKSLAFVEGASHMFTPDKQAEEYNHTSYGDTVKHLFDYVATWANNKFVK